MLKVSELRGVEACGWLRFATCRNELPQTLKLQRLNPQP